MLLQLEWLTSLPWAHYRRLRDPHATRFPRQRAIPVRCGSLRTPSREDQASIDGASRRRSAARLHHARARGRTGQGAGSYAQECHRRACRGCQRNPITIKAGEIPAPPRVPASVSPQSKTLSKAKAIKAPNSTVSSAITWLLLFG